MSGLDLNDNGHIDYTALFTTPPTLHYPVVYPVIIRSRTKSKLFASETSDTPTTFKPELRCVAVSLGVAPRALADVCLLSGNVGGLMPWKQPEPTQPTAE